MLETKRKLEEEKALLRRIDEKTQKQEKNYILNKDNSREKLRFSLGGKS